MAAYYNEHEPFAAAWLRELIKRGHIADGEVDERSICDVEASDLVGFRQCHFFAGIGVWSYALRNAGWPDEREVWTGSCPCQPFSAAGKGKGIEDERHLWPEFFRLIAERKPAVCFGEQVAQKAGAAWFDIVQADLARENYASGMVVFPACGLGAPHQRQRLYWVAEGLGNASQCGDSNGKHGTVGAEERALQKETWQGNGEAIRASSSVCGVAKRECLDRRTIKGSKQPARHECGESACDCSEFCGVANDEHEQHKGCVSGSCVDSEAQGGRSPAEPTGHSAACGTHDAECIGRNARREDNRQDERDELGAADSVCGTSNADCERLQRFGSDGDQEGRQGQGVRPSGLRDGAGDIEAPGPVNGFWGMADWLGCTDQKFRPVEPGTFPLADGAANRVGRLRGFGNAIVAPQAEIFIKSFIESQ